MATDYNAAILYNAAICYNGDTACVVECNVVECCDPDDWAYAIRGTRTPVGVACNAVECSCDENDYAYSIR